MKYQVTVLSAKANEEPYFVCYANSEAEADFLKDVLHYYPAFRYSDIKIEKIF